MEASNIKAMRDALLKVKKLFDGRIMFQKAVREAHEVVNAAISAPPRNCDVGTVEEQEERFTKFCSRQDCKRTCPLYDDYDSYRCEFAWGQMPYEEGDAGKEEK